MPILDRYLEAMSSNSAEALVFSSNRIVEVVIGGRLMAISAGPATHEQVLGLAAEVLGADFPSRLTNGQGTFSYRSPTGLMSLLVVQNTHGLSIQVQPAPGVPTVPPPGPVTSVFGSGGTPASIAVPHAPPAREDVQGAVPADQGPDGGPPHLDELFNHMIDLGASDLHLKTDKTPMVRIDGSMQPLPGWPVFSERAVRRLIMAITPPRHVAEFDETNDTDFAYEMPRARVRCNVFRDMAGIGAVFRQIPNQIRSTEELGLPPVVLEFCRLTKGLIVVTGPTGSGKSTTLAAMIDWINQNRADHIITIEDPVEFVHPDKRCHVNQREVGTQTRNFKGALRAALREDPDIVMVGEMRDLETVAMAIETAETGHLVFATLHTNTAASTIDRLIDQFPADRQAQIRAMLAESIKGIVAQTLCRKKGGGRVAALEILVVNTAISNLIREGKTHQIASTMQTGKSLGMQTLNDALLELVKAGTVDPQDAYDRAVQKKEFVMLLGRSGFKGSWAD